MNNIMVHKNKQVVVRYDLNIPAMNAKYFSWEVPKRNQRKSFRRERNQLVEMLISQGIYSRVLFSEEEFKQLPLSVIVFAPLEKFDHKPFYETTKKLGLDYRTRDYYRKPAKV